MQKLSTVRISMGLIWVLLLQKTAEFYGKSVFVTSCHLALLSQILKFSPEHNIALIVFKSCHSDHISTQFVCTEKMLDRLVGHFLFRQG